MSNNSNLKDNPAYKKKREARIKSFFANYPNCYKCNKGVFEIVEEAPLKVTFKCNNCDLTHDELLMP